MSTWSLVIKNVIDIDREKRTSMYYTYEVKNGIGKKYAKQRVYRYRPIDKNDETAQQFIET